MNKKIKISTILVYIILISIAISTIFPLVFMIISSFKDKIEYMKNMFGLPSEWKLNNFQAIFKSFNVLQLMRNSFFVTSISVVISLLTNSMAAYSLTKLKYVGRAAIFRLVMFVLLVPAQALMMPIYIIISNMGLVNQHLGVILVYVSTSIAFSTFLLCQNCKDIPDEILEAARIDGSGYVQIYWKIILPMLRPTMATLGILNFLGYWNEVVYSKLILQKTEIQTMTLGLMSISGKHGTNMPLLMSGLMINLLPAMVIFIIFRKYLTKGISMGSGK